MLNFKPTRISFLGMLIKGDIVKKDVVLQKEMFTYLKELHLTSCKLTVCSLGLYKQTKDLLVHFKNTTP